MVIKKGITKDRRNEVIDWSFEFFKFSFFSKILDVLISFFDFIFISSQIVSMSKFYVSCLDKSNELFLSM